MSRHRSSFIWLFVLTLLTNGLFCVLTYDTAGRWFTPLDDAFIYFQYAERAAQLLPFTHQEGRPFSTGATSPLYPLLLAPFAAFLKVESLAGLTLVLSFFWKWLASIGVYLLVWRVARHRTPALLAGILVTLSGAFTHGAMNGMETGLYGAALALLAAVLCRRLYTAKQTAVLVGLLALVTLLRPEAALIPAALFLSSLLPRSRLRGLLPALLVSLIPVAAYLLFVRLQTGEFTTSTAGSKLISGHPYQTPIVMIGRAASETDSLLRTRIAGELALPPVFLLIAAVSLVPLYRRRLVTVLLLFLPVSVVFFSVNPMLNDARYFMPYVPLLVGLWVIGAWTGLRLVPRGHRRAAWAVLAIAAVVAVAPSLFSRGRQFSETAAEMRRMHLEAAHWIDSNLDQNAVVGIHDAGVLSAVGRRRVLDFNGLVSPEFHNIAPAVPGGIYENLSRLTIDQYPTHIASFPGWTPEPLRADVVARFPYEENRWASGEALTVWEAALPDLVLPLKPVLLGWREDQGWRITDALNHGDLASEQAHSYECLLTNRWKMDPYASLRRMPAGRTSPFLITEGGRTVSEREVYTLAAVPGREARLVVRCHLVSDAELSIRAGDLKKSLTLRKIPYEFQEFEIRIPPENVVTNPLRIQIKIERDGETPAPDGIEIYHAWLLQQIGEDEEPARSFARELSRRQVAFEESVLDWFARRSDPRLPMGKRQELFWHIGFRHAIDDQTDASIRIIDNVRVALTVPAQRIDEAPALVFDATLDAYESAIWGYRCRAVVDDVEAEPILIEQNPSLQFSLPLPREALRRGLNRVRIRFEPIHRDPATGDSEDAENYHPPMTVDRIELVGLGWE